MSARNARVGSLAWVFLLAILTLGIGALLFLSFNETMPIIFDRPEWQPDPGSAASDAETAEDVASGHGTLQALWTATPVIIVVAVCFSVLIRARRIKS
jgi:hypothetical protein